MYRICYCCECDCQCISWVFVTTSLADHRARVRAGRNRWSTGQHFCPAQAICSPAALVHSTTSLLESQTCNRVIHIQPRGWIAAPCRTELSSTHISDNVCTYMEWIKYELKESSTLTEYCSEPSLADRARHHDQDRAWGVGRVHWLVEHSATSMVTLAPDYNIFSEGCHISFTRAVILISKV